MVDRARRKDAPMLEVKKARAAEAGSDPTTAQYVDRMAREAQPVSLRIDGRPPLVIKDARAYQLLWSWSIPSRRSRRCARVSSRWKRAGSCRSRSSTDD
jgi:hypothetical protein